MFVHATEAPIQQVDVGVTRQILGHDPDLMMVRVTFAKGAVSVPHTHPHRQVTYVERGRFEATVNGRTAIVGAGDCFFVAPGASHGVVALDEGTLIDVFTPARMDLVG